MDDRFWNPAETWSRDRLAAGQLDTLRRQLSSVARRSSFYRQRWAGWDPREPTTRDDLRQLPFVDKRDYPDGLGDEPPWGSTLAVDPREIRRVHFSSGTTSAPTPVLWSGPDLERWADL